MTRAGSRAAAARFLRLVRYARQSATRFDARRFELSFSVVYRLLSIKADG